MYKNLFKLVNHHEIQITTTIWYYFMSTWLVNIKSRNTKCSQQRGKTGTLIHGCWECKLKQLWRTVCHYLRKLKTCNIFLGPCLQGTSICAPGHTEMDVPSSMAGSSKNRKQCIGELSVSWLVNDSSVVWWTALRHWQWTPHSPLPSAPEHITPWKTQFAEKYIQCDSISREFRNMKNMFR